MMTYNDTLADALNIIKTHERVGKMRCRVRASKLVREVLKKLQENGYVDEFEFVDDGKSGFYDVKLSGRINECKAIKPRFPVKADEIIDWERKYLPSVNYGILILTTPKGVMTNREAREQKIGGRLLAYVY